MKSLEHKTSLIFDLFFCIVIMPLMIVLSRVHYWWGVSPVFTCLTTIYLYGCYFVIKALNLPRLILSKSYYKLGGIFAAMILATYLLTLYPLPKMDFVIPSMSEYQTRVRNYNMAITVWFMLSIIICYSLTVAFVKELYHRLLLQSIIENQRDKAQLALYKAQINPHFLFNTLNSLYSLVIGTSQKAEDAFIKFTELLKYTYVTADNDWVTIDDEINYINNYINLQLIRLNTHTAVEWDCLVDDPAANIAPMIFLTFVENTFKYGASTSHDCKILIKLRLDKGILTFKTENKIIKHSDEFRKDVPVGINNCRSRLSGLYPDRYVLNIMEEDGIFMVYLKIDLNAHD
jgi:signal transduction histidine kinase, lytS